MEVPSGAKVKPIAAGNYACRKRVREDPNPKPYRSLPDWDRARVEARISLMRGDDMQRRLRARVAQDRQDKAWEGGAFQRACARRAARYQEFSLDGRRRQSTADPVRGTELGEAETELEQASEAGDEANECRKAQQTKPGHCSDDQSRSEEIDIRPTRYDPGVEMEAEKFVARAWAESRSQIHTSIRTPWEPRTEPAVSGRSMPWDSVAMLKQREERERMERIREDSRDRILRSKPQQKARRREQSRADLLAALRPAITPERVIEIK